MHPSEEAMLRASRVVRFLQQPSYFDKPVDTSMPTALFINDVVMALKYANKLDFDDDSYEDLTEVLEVQSAKIKISLPSVFKVISGKLSTLVSDLIRAEAFNEFLTEQEQQLLAANFDYQMVGCVLNLNASNLYDLTLTAFEAGGIPCGWLGKYPKGKLIVYLPAATISRNQS
jgi:hypothetical protein